MGRRFSWHRTWSFRALIVSNLKWGEGPVAATTCFRQADIKSSTIFYKRRIEGISLFCAPDTVALEWPRQGPPPHLTRETLQRPQASGAYPGGVFVQAKT